MSNEKFPETELAITGTRLKKQVSHKIKPNIASLKVDENCEKDDTKLTLSRISTGRNFSENLHY